MKSLTTAHHHAGRCAGQRKRYFGILRSEDPQDEHMLYPMAIDLCVTEKVKLEGRKVRLL